jgi:two-component system phosphate regulon sensor histidine kinase PhoR
MPIDYRHLVAGLGAITAAADDLPQLAAIESLVATVWHATGAAGATFTEHGAQGGRVVVAHGAMAFALGQPIPPELVGAEPSHEPFVGQVEKLPVSVRDQLASRGIGVLAGHPVCTGERVVGALHLFFVEPPDRAEVEPVLRVAALLAEHLCRSRESLPVRSAVEEDDRSLFLAVAGHELRTPVTVIKGYASLVAGRWDALSEEERRSAVQVLSQRADELAALLDRLVGVSAGDATSVAVRRIPFDPVAALVRAANDLPAELRRALRVELPNQLPPACGDPDVLGTVVTELVTNAVRASTGPAGAAQLSSVDLSAGADADTVFIRVSDRGVGIDPAHTDRAFERFWRGRADGDGRGGVGLGLYLVRRLVERQEGWVSLRPRDGGGTVAEVRLARADGPPRVLSGFVPSGRAREA